MLVVSIDTEEDNWTPTRERLTVENVRELPHLDAVLARLGVRATYFITHEVANTPWSAEIIGGLAQSGQVEVGAHLHPWNTPPVTSALTAESTMLANLPVEEQRAKINVLTEVINSRIGSRPTSFRAGRWGFVSSTAQALIDCGYQVDSSVTPFRSWSGDHGPSHIGAPLDVYRIDPREDHRVASAGGQLVEVPVSWGYSQKPWSLVQRLNLVLDSPGVRRLQLARLAARLHLLNHVVLSPEIETVAHMLSLVRSILARGVRHLHLTFHSTSLRAGLSPFSRTETDVDRFYRNLDSVIEKIAVLTPVRFATVGEAALLLASAPG